MGCIYVRYIHSYSRLALMETREQSGFRIAITLVCFIHYVLSAVLGLLAILMDFFLQLSLPLMNYYPMAFFSILILRQGCVQNMFLHQVMATEIVLSRLYISLCTYMYLRSPSKKIFYGALS